MVYAQESVRSSVEGQFLKTLRMQADFFRQNVEINLHYIYMTADQAKETIQATVLGAISFDFLKKEEVRTIEIK